MTQHDGQSFESLRDQIREVACTELGPLIEDCEHRRIITPEVVGILAQSGCFARILPIDLGGLGGTVEQFTVQQEELARVWPTAAVVATWANLSGRLVNRFGTSDQRQRLIPRLAAGRSLGAVAWTEPHGGSDAAGVRTTAKAVDGGWVLNGSKRLIDNAAGADFLVVGARSGAADSRHRGISMFIVERDDPGFLFGGAHDTLGLRPAGVGWFTLEDCFVPSDRLLGGLDRGFYQMMDMVELGRTGVSAICLGMAETCLTLAASFQLGREAFGQRLSDNDAVLATVADLRTAIDAARLLTERAARMADAGVPCATEAAMAKLFSSELAVRAATTSLHLHGGIGFTSESSVERFLRDSQAFTIGEGTSEVMRLVIGRKEFADVQATIREQSEPLILR